MQRHPSKLASDSHTPQSLKLQMGLAVLGSLCLFGGAIARKRSARFIGGLAWALMLLSGLSFCKKILHRDAAVLVVAPLLLFARALALSLGLCAGTARLLYLQRIKGSWE